MFNWLNWFKKDRKMFTSGDRKRLAAAFTRHQKDKKTLVAVCGISGCPIWDENLPQLMTHGTICVCYGEIFVVQGNAFVSVWTVTGGWDDLVLHHQ